MTIYLLGGPGDIGLCQFILETCKRDNLIMLAGKSVIFAIGGTYERAVMNYVNDSAPMHFASAMNAPVTAVYCSTVPEFGFGPLSDIRHIVEIEQPFYCRPCGLHGYAACPQKHFNCAKQIKDEQLVKTMPS